VKISLFNVSDLENPKELSKIFIGDRGTESDALHNPHTFLFSKNRNLLVIPVMLAEINGSPYNRYEERNQVGDLVWSGAYLFNISPESGIEIKGRITHMNDYQNKSCPYYNYFESSLYENKIRRSFYIENTLYTISDNQLRANDLDDLSLINYIKLP
jgi:uncharacterized secreted protein with C-terminal beta-propeller domain